MQLRCALQQPESPGLPGKEGGVEKKERCRASLILPAEREQSEMQDRHNRVALESIIREDLQLMLLFVCGFGTDEFLELLFKMTLLNVDDIIEDL